MTIEPLKSLPPEGDPAPEPANERLTVTYPSPIFDGFDQAGAPCPVCRTRAPLPTVRMPLAGVPKVQGQTPCQQFHQRCWEIVSVMKAVEKRSGVREQPRIFLPFGR